MRGSHSILLMAVLILFGYHSWAQQKSVPGDKKEIEFKAMSAPIPGVPLEKGKIGRATTDILIVPQSKGNSPGNVNKAELSQTIEFKASSGPVPGVPLVRGKVDKAYQDKPIIPQGKENARGNTSKGEAAQLIEFKAMSEPLPGVPLEKGRIGYAGRDSLLGTGKERDSGLLGAVLTKPNLIANYTPVGWDAPIIASNATGTHTNGTINAGTTFIDYAFVNRDADVPTSTRFYVYLYYDGGYVQGWFWDGIGKDYYAYVNDYQLPFSVTAGTRTLKTKVDATGIVDESNELDDEYSKQFTWLPAKPNLIANYIPLGWDAPIIASDAIGTHRNGTLYAGTTYIDFAFINRDADIPTNMRLYVYLYYDGSYVYGWYWDGMAKDSYGHIDDYQLPFPVAAGTHTLKTKIDPTGALDESNELDNEYSQQFTWLTPPTTKPNLIANYTPPGWDAPIVTSNVIGTHTIGALYAGTSYVDLAFVNRDEDIPATTRFYIYLYYDGAYVQGWYWDGMAKDYYGHIDDYQLPPSVTAGTHTLKTKIDATGAVDESNEPDNEYSRQFTWLPAKPNLIANYTPAGWDAPIIASNATGTHTSGTLYAGTTYIDFAFINRDADVPTSTRVYVYLYYEGNYVYGWYWDGIGKDYYGYVNDYQLPFSVAAGTHTLKTKVDATGVVDESNELDNELWTQFTWLTPLSTKPNLIANYTPPGWDYPIVPSNRTGTHTVGILNAGTTYIDFASVNRDQDIPTGTRFYVYLYYDGSYLQGWSWDGMPKDYYGYLEDFQIPFAVTAGAHTIRASVDATNVVQESNESDNLFEKQYVFAAIGKPKIRVTPATITIEQGR